MREVDTTSTMQSNTRSEALEARGREPTAPLPATVYAGVGVL
jgi:hypothetical protein